MGKNKVMSWGCLQGFPAPQYPKSISQCRNFRNFSMFSSAIQWVVLSSQAFLWGSAGLPFVGAAANCCLFSVFLPFIHKEFSNHIWSHLALNRGVKSYVNCASTGIPQWGSDQCCIAVFSCFINRYLYSINTISYAAPFLQCHHFTGKPKAPLVL